ncbi:hypothetical protein DV515_00019981 [Chloebia gouldiae]|uniref:Uncharacterized protein n=1 Tax=Chloebia gouldiae TaxID=44316 RepID=A0A3L8Q3Q1_CHLGU|nr:hypothetical protein DV515_00019981 [Chloebia gouldiae]
MRHPLKPKEGRLLLLRPPPPPGDTAGAAAGPPARHVALLELGLPLAADLARCHARFHRRSKGPTVTMPLRA